jgi:hypothetical protein
MLTGVESENFAQHHPICVEFLNLPDLAAWNDRQRQSRDTH